MPVAASDIVAYGAATRVNDNTTADPGGAIDTTCRYVFTDISATDTLEVVSSDADDTTQDLTVYGRNAAGELVSETQTLNGTTQVNFATSFERILKAILDGAAEGTVTLRKASDNVTIMAFEPGLLEIRRPFYNASADAAGGSERKFYEKIFFKNNHGTLSLTSAVISENADPSGKLAFAVEAALNGSTTVANRLTAPALTFNSNAKNVANSQNLTAGAAQAVWLELTLAAGDAAADTSVTMRVAGNTV